MLGLISTKTGELEKQGRREAAHRRGGAVRAARTARAVAAVRLRERRRRQRHHAGTTSAASSSWWSRSPTRSGETSRLGADAPRARTQLCLAARRLSCRRDADSCPGAGAARVQRRPRRGAGPRAAAVRAGPGGYRGAVRRQPAARGRPPDRDGLCGPPVRSFRATARRWPRAAARGKAHARRAPAGHPVEGCRPHAVLALRRRPGRGRPDAARVPRQRGDACARHSDDALAGGGRHWRARVSGRGSARRGAHPGGGQPPARRHVRVFRRARGSRGAGAAARLRHRPP